MSIANIRTEKRNGVHTGIKRLLAASCTGLILLAAGTAAAQEDPLKGPKVVDRAPPGERAFGEQGQERGPGRMARRAAPHAMFLRAVNSLEGDLEVSEDQREQIMAIEQEFRSKMRAFREEHRDELNSLRKRARMPGPEDGARPDGPPGPPPGEGRPERGWVRPGGDDKDVPADVAEARKKLRALMESAPKHDEYQARQWAVLTEDQQNAVKGVMEDIRGRMERGEFRRPPGPPSAPSPRGGPGLRDGDRGPEGAERRRQRGGRGAPPPPPQMERDENEMEPPAQD